MKQVLKAVMKVIALLLGIMMLFGGGLCFAADAVSCDDGNGWSA